VDSRRLELAEGEQQNRRVVQTGVGLIKLRGWGRGSRKQSGLLGLGAQLEVGDSGKRLQRHRYVSQYTWHLLE